MNKLKYLLRRIKSMDFRNMIKQAKVVHGRTGKFTFFILIDMIYCGFAYLAGYMDYVVFEFYNLNRAQRKTQVTRGRNNEFVRRLNQKDAWYKFDNKMEFNRIFSKYIRRNWLDITNSSLEEFEAFVTRYQPVIVKPIDGTCGSGVEKLSLSDFENVQKMYEHCISNHQEVAEEFIYQHTEMNRLFPSSVNTLRIVTITYQGRVSIVFCGIRIGAGKTVVDNLNSGGMAAVVDSQSGVILTDAADKNGKIFDKHPDTDVVIKGFQIPMFEQVKALIDEVAHIVPEIGYVGWDVAITNEHPLLIEGNHFPGHDIYQMPALVKGGYGLLPLFYQALGEQ